MTDINPFSVAIQLDDDADWSKQATMFKANGKLGVKKTIAFTHDQDVHCAIDYEASDVLPVGTE